jgi:hypothetical protein
MDRSRLIAERLGKEFRQLFVNEGLWLYFRGMETLFISAVRHVEADQLFSYVAESE